MKIKKIEIDVYDVGVSWEEEANRKLQGAVHVHTMQSPYNAGRGMIIYAFYPEDTRMDEMLKGQIKA